MCAVATENKHVTLQDHVWCLKEVVMTSDVRTIKFLKTNIVTMISEFDSTVYNCWSQYCLAVENICLTIGGYSNI